MIRTQAHKVTHVTLMVDSRNHGMGKTFNHNTFKNAKNHRNPTDNFARQRKLSRRTDWNNTDAQEGNADSRNRDSDLDWRDIG